MENNNKLAQINKLTLITNVKDAKDKLEAIDTETYKCMSASEMNNYIRSVDNLKKELTAYLFSDIDKIINILKKD